MNDYFEPNWRCKAHRVDATAAVQDSTENGWQEYEVLRTNRVMRGVLFPAGDYDVIVFYDSPRMRWGGWVSVLASCGFVVLLTIAMIGRRRTKP